MAKKVMLKIIGTQVNELGEEDIIEFFTHGNYYIKNNCYYILYNESEVSGMEGVTTSVKAERDRVTLNRMGTAECKMVFQEGVPNSSHYITPFGAMQLNVVPTCVAVDLTEVGGSIKLEYELNDGDVKLSDNNLLITIEEGPC